MGLHRLDGTESLPQSAGVLTRSIAARPPEGERLYIPRFVLSKSNPLTLGFDLVFQREPYIHIKKKENKEND